MDPDKELPFLEQEENQKIFNDGYDQPIDEDVLRQNLGARQMGFADDELDIIEGTLFKTIMDDMDANDINYRDVDVYKYIPAEERLTPYLIFQEGARNKWYTEEFVEYLIKVSARGAFTHIDVDPDIPFKPTASLHEYALFGAQQNGPEALERMMFDIILDKDSRIGGVKPRDLTIKYTNELFKGGYKATLEEGDRLFWEEKGMTPEGDWLPEVKEKFKDMLWKEIDADGNVTYKDKDGNIISPDDPRITDEDKFEDLTKQLEKPAEDLTPQEQVKKMLDDGIITDSEYEEMLFNIVVDEVGDTPPNVVDYQDTGVGGRPFEIKDGVPVDKSGNPIKSVGAADETITIYRVVPEGVDSVNANDWVFINKGQAEEALKNANANTEGNFNLIEIEVNKGDVYPSTRGNLEMGYFPKDTPTNVVDDKLKRINEILEQGIKATGIDADPDAPNYLTDYATEHGDLIRELENNGTLEELQDLVGGSEELDNLITDIANKQSEVAPRYLSATPPLNEYGEEFGAKGAYGITTEELRQKEIQDVIKQTLGIDTPPTDRPTLRVGDDEVPTIKLSGTMGGSGTPDGPNVVYMKTEDAIKMVEYDRMVTQGLFGVGMTPDEYISAMGENIKKNGFFLDRYDIEEGRISATSFSVTVDKNGYLQIGEGNHRLRAYLDAGVEYVPVHVNPSVSSTKGALGSGAQSNRIAILPDTNGNPTTESRKAVYEAMIELFEDLGASEYTIEQKLGDPIGDETLIKLVEDWENLDEATKESIRIRNRTWTGSNYTNVGGQGGNTTSQENIKKFFKAIGIETVTFDELPETDIHKVMVNNPESIVNNVNPNRNTLRVGDDSVPTVHKTIEYIKGFAVVKNPDNFWKESLETLFGEDMTKGEYIKTLVDKPDTLFYVDEAYIPAYEKMLGVNFKNGQATFNDFGFELQGPPEGLPGDGPAENFDKKFGEQAYAIRNDRKFFDNNTVFINETLIPALESGNINKLDDVEKVKLTQLIYRLQSYESTNQYSLTDQKADIIKKVFMGGVPIFETGLNRRPSFVDQAGVNQKVVDLLLDNQEILKTIVQDVVRKAQKPFLPDTEYMLVFRLGDLGYHDGSPNGTSSFTKSYTVALGMADYQKDNTLGKPLGDKGGEIRAYLVPTEHVIDTEALGIRGGLGGNEKEVLVVDEYVIPLDTQVNEDGLGNVVEYIVEGTDELTDNEIVEAIARQRKNILRTGDDLVELGGANYSQRVRNVATQYAEMFGLPEPSFIPITVFADEIGAIGADIFDALPAFDPAAIPYYKKFINETNVQYEALLNSGLQIELVDVDPYTPNQIGHQAMMQDMERGVLKILSTEGSFGSNVSVDQNPMLETSKYVDINGRTMTNNDVFRAVHDTFGHGMRGNTFGPKGEYNAWLAHKELYSPDAQRVMTTETLGQNTFTNYGQHMRDETGRIIGKGEAGHIKPLDRPFADQKVALMPENYIKAAGSVITDINDLDTVNPEKLAQVMELAAKEPGLSSQIWNQSKKMVGNLFKTTQVLDPGDIIIEQSLMRMLPRLGLGAIAAPVLYAYVAYELTLLALDVGNAWDKAQANQGGPSDQYVPSFMGGKTIEGEEPKYIDYDWKRMGKDMWQEMGSVSDTWSLSWKISEPIINKAFEEIGEHVVELSDEEKRGYALSGDNIGYTGY